MKLVEIFFPIIFLAGLGYIFGKFKKFDLRSLTELVIYLTGPSLMFTYLARRTFVLNDFAYLAVGTAFVILASGIIVYLALKLGRVSPATDYYMPSLFMNSSFIGFPIALFAFGQAGLSDMIIYDLVNTFFILTLGIWLLTRRERSWEIFKLPHLYVATLAIFCSARSIVIPDIIYQPLKMLGEATIPLMLFALGYRLNILKVRQLTPALVISGFRIGLGFILAVIFVTLFRVPDLTGKIIILGSSLPCAVSAFIFSEKFGLESELAASAVMVSTLISIITLPLILIFLGSY